MEVDRVFVHDHSPEKSKTLVLIHGQVIDSSYWDDALPSFDARLLVPDMPGHGRSAADVVMDWPKVHDGLEAALLAKTKGPVHLVGFSLGSYHALALTLRGALKVETLTMLGPWPGNDKAVLDTHAGHVPVIRSGTVPWVEVFLGSCFSAEYAAQHPAAVARARAQIARGAVHALIEELARFPAMSDLRPRLGEVKVPLLVRVGDKDPSTPAAVGEAMAKANPLVKLEVVPGVAHHYLAQDFEGTVASIKRFTGC
jgi:pimeloyl-ACP methyl ester carboxylesterase